MNNRTPIAFPHPTRRRRKTPARCSQRSILAASAASLLSLFAIPGNASAGLASAPASFWLGGTDGTWTGANWASDAAGTPTAAIPTSTSDITFSATGAQHQTTTLGATTNTTIHSLTISDPVPVTINSWIVPIGSSHDPFPALTASLSSSSLDVLPSLPGHSLTLSGYGGLNVLPGAGLVTINVDLTFGVSRTTVNNTAGVVFNGALTATSSLSKEGTGTLTLAGPSIFQSPSDQPSYTLRVAGGTLAIDNDGITTHGTLDSAITNVETGELKFLHLASGGNGIINTSGALLFVISDGGGSGSTGPGTTSFYDHSTAGSASFYTNGAGIGGLPSGSVNFHDHATASDGIFVTYGSWADPGGSVNFYDNSTAGRASITATWGGGGGGGGGRTVFNDSSNAENATIVAQGAGPTFASDGGAVTQFNQHSSAGNAKIFALGATAPVSGGGVVQFNDSSSAGNAVITVTGGTSVGAGGGVIQFNDFSHANNATLIATGGTNGGDGGGAVYFKGNSSGDSAAVQLSGNAKLDISGNSSQIFIGSLAGAGGKVFLGSNPLVIGGNPLVSPVFNNASTTFSGTIQDGGVSGGAGGGIAKFGTGTLTLTGANTYTGVTAVHGGTLAAGNAKAFGSSNLSVVDATVRTAGGPIAVDVGAGGFYFGNGSANQVGPVDQSSGGTFLATVGGTAPGVTHDQLKTTGSAEIGGLRLELVQLNNYHLKRGDKVVLISALGGVTGLVVDFPLGVFGGLTGAGGVLGGTPNGTPMPRSRVVGLDAFGSALLVPVVNIYTTSVVLEAIQVSFGTLAKTLAFTPNQNAISGALDQLIPQIGSNSEVTKAFELFDTLPASEIPALLELLSPAGFTSAFNLASALANVQSTNIQQRLAEVRGANSGGAPVSGNSGGGANGPAGSRGNSLPPAPEERWGLWMTGSGEFVHIGSTTNGAGFNLDSGGVTAGVDYRFSDHFVAGISLGYMNTVSSLQNGGKIDVDGGRLGAYATWYHRGLHFDAAVTGGFNSFGLRRTAPGNTSVTASPDGAEVNLLFAAGHDWKWKSLTLGPTASFQYTNVQLDGFTERGIFAPLSVASQNAESLRSSLGFKVSFDKRIGRAILRPEVRAAWQHEFGDVTHSLTANFATLGGTPFTVTGPTTGRDSMLLTAGFSVQWNARFATYAYYDAELFRTNYSSNNVSVGFRYQF